MFGRLRSFKCGLKRGARPEETEKRMEWQEMPEKFARLDFFKNLKRSWARFGGRLGRLEGFLVRFGGLLGRLGVLLVRLGGLLGHLGAFRSLRNSPSGFQETPKSAQEASKRPQEASKRPQDAPKSPQEAPKMAPKRHPKQFQELLGP